MIYDVAEVERALLALGEHDRVAVIIRGLQSLDTEAVNTDQSELDTAWSKELQQRIDDIESGKVELLGANEVHAQIRSELATIRK